MNMISTMYTNLVAALAPFAPAPAPSDGDQSDSTMVPAAFMSAILGGGVICGVAAGAMYANGARGPLAHGLAAATALLFATAMTRRTAYVTAVCVSGACAGSAAIMGAMWEGRFFVKITINIADIIRAWKTQPVRA